MNAFEIITEGELFISKDVLSFKGALLFIQKILGILHWNYVLSRKFRTYRVKSS